MRITLDISEHEIAAVKAIAKNRIEEIRAMPVIDNIQRWKELRSFQCFLVGLYDAICDAENIAKNGKAG